MRAYVPDYELKVIPDLREALLLMAQEPGKWRPFAGGTDLMVLYEAGSLDHHKFLSLWHYPELRGIQIAEDSVTLGALTTYSQIVAHPLLQSEFTMLCRAAGWTGSIAIQNRGTLGGNIANASPAGDSLPVLLAYDAELELLSASGSRWVPYRGFHTGYKQSVMRSDEIIKAIRIKRPGSDWVQWTRKVGTRKAQAISKVCIAAMAMLDGDVIADCRLAYASVGPVPFRCAMTENLLRGRKTDAATRAVARTELLREIKPIDDIRSTGEYRAQVSANLLDQFLGAL